MGLSAAVPRPEEADSWGEFHARLEMEAAAPGSPWTPLRWAAGGALFGAALITSAYAFQGGRWWLWLWLCMLGSLGAVGVLAARAVDGAARKQDRAAELARLQDAWFEHLQRNSKSG